MVDFLNVSDTTPRVSYVATASQTTFTVPFAFHDETHLDVYKNNVLLTYTTQYSVTGVDSATGGFVVLVTGATVSDSIVIVRTVPYELTTHIAASGPLDIPALNIQFALFVMMLQQFDADNARSIRQPASDVTDLTDLPVAASRASKYLFFDATGQPTVAASVSSSVAASAFMLTLLDDLTAAAARTTLGITDQSAYVGLSNYYHCR